MSLGHALRGLALVVANSVYYRRLQKNKIIPCNTVERDYEINESVTIHDKLFADYTEIFNKYEKKIISFIGDEEHIEIDKLMRCIDMKIIRLLNKTRETFR